MSTHQESAARLWVPAFDGVRGIVSLSIALVHIQLAVDWLPNHELWQALRASWFFSIEFLFLLGGFVAFLPIAHYGRFGGIRSYALRRAGRVFPLYYLTILLAVLLGPWLRPVAGVAPPHDFLAVLAHLGFVQQMVLPFKSGLGVTGIVWTMSIVAVFWLVFPFVARPYLRHPLVGLAGFLAVGIGWRLACDGHPNAFLQAPLFFTDFGIGMSAALVYVRIGRDERLRRRAGAALAAWVPLVVLLFVLLYVSGLPVARDQGHHWDEGVLLSVLVPAVFAAILVLAPFTPRWAQWPLANPISRWIGQIGYGLFLFHFIVIWSVLAVVDIPRNGSPQSLLELTAIAIPLTLLCGWLGTRFVEQPIRERAARAAARVRHSEPSRPGTAHVTPSPAAAAPSPRQ